MYASPNAAVNAAAVAAEIAPPIIEPLIGIVFNMLATIVFPSTVGSRRSDCSRYNSA